MPRFGVIFQRMDQLKVDIEHANAAANEKSSKVYNKAIAELEQLRRDLDQAHVLDAVGHPWYLPRRHRSCLELLALTLIHRRMALPSLAAPTRCCGTSRSAAARWATNRCPTGQIGTSPMASSACSGVSPASLKSHRSRMRKRPTQTMPKPSIWAANTAVPRRRLV